MNTAPKRGRPKGSRYEEARSPMAISLALPHPQGGARRVGRPQEETMKEYEYTVVMSAVCDGGLQIARIEDGEDCCAAARRHGGICHHGAAEGGGGAPLEECQAYCDRLRERDTESEE